MRKFFAAIGHFFKKRWAILVTAVIALFIGGAGGFAIGHVNSNNSFNGQQMNFNPGQGRSQEQRQYPGQNGQFGQDGQMPTPPSGFPELQGGTDSGNSDSNSNSDDSSNSNVSTDTSFDTGTSV